MTQEDRELLLKDLCARLPYGVKYMDILNTDEYPSTLQSIDECGLVMASDGFSLEIENVKPYLFPLSSMTDEQREEFNSFFASVQYYGDNEREYVVPYYFVELLIDFFHKNHIDNNGLIPMGLALDATGKNIY